MAQNSKVTYVSDIMVDNAKINIKKPFKISHEDQRRFIRIEIASPVSLRNLQDEVTEAITRQNFYDITGTILNISPGGVLVETEVPVMEQDLVLMKFTIQGTANITNVLGLVKRVDGEDSSYLLGIEFLQPSNLRDRLSEADLSLIQSSIGSFENRIQETLSEYLY